MRKFLWWVTYLYADEPCFCYQHEVMHTLIHVYIRSCYHAYMNIITLLSQKGGSGKSTLAISLAVCADQHNENVLVLDIDPQGSVASWSERRTHSTTPVVLHIQPRTLPNTLAKARENGADWIFIDTAGHHNQDAFIAAQLADIVLIPCRPSIIDMDAIQASILSAKQAGKPIYVVLNGVSPVSTTQATQLVNLIRTNYGVSAFSTWVSNRSAFMHSALEGQSAAEWSPHDRAAHEILNLREALIEAVNRI